MIATSSTNGRHVEPPPAAVGENIANLAQEMLTLGELQVKLLLMDLKSSRDRALTPSAILIGGSCFLLGTTPVLLLAIADILSQSLGWDLPLARFAVAGVSFCISIAAMSWAAKALVGASQSLSRSRSEFLENLSWIKNVIRQSTSSTRK